MQTSSLPPFLSHSFQYGGNRREASEKVHESLDTISQATFMMVNDRGDLVECDFIEWFFEQIKGLFGCTNHAKKECVRLRTMQLIAFSATQGYITKEDCQGPGNLISRVAKNMGLTPDEPRRRDLDELDELITSVVVKTLNPKITTPDYQKPINNYFARHIKDRTFEPHTIFARVLLEWLDFLVSDDKALEDKIIFDEEGPIIDEANPPSTVQSNFIPTVRASELPQDSSIARATSSKVSSWMKKVGLGLLGTGVFVGAAYGVTNYTETGLWIKRLIVTPPPPPPESSNYMIYIIIGAVVAGALGAFLKGSDVKKKVEDRVAQYNKGSSFTVRSVSWFKTKATEFASKLTSKFTKASSKETKTGTKPESGTRRTEKFDLPSLENINTGSASNHSKSTPQEENKEDASKANPPSSLGDSAMFESFEIIQSPNDSTPGGKTNNQGKEG